MQVKLALEEQVSAMFCSYFHELFLFPVLFLKTEIFGDKLMERIAKMCPTGGLL